MGGVPEYPRHPRNGSSLHRHPSQSTRSHRPNHRAAAEAFPSSRRPARNRSSGWRALLRSDEVAQHAHVSRRVLTLLGKRHGRMIVLETAPPRITLRNAPAEPFDGAIAAARTCYSPRVIGTHEVTDKQRDTIGALTFDAGHHTVYQHANFEFGLENISRQFVWTFLHSYPSYNSEQSSQRYVKLKEPRAFVPSLSGEALDVYQSAVERAWDRYAELSALLKDDALAILKELRYVRPTTNPERLKGIERDAEKRAIETARYVIPVAAFTSMVHTVSGIVLHRLNRMVNTGDAPAEARTVIGEMVRLVREWDPLFFEKVGLAPIDAAAVPEASFPRPRGGADRYAAAFDARLGGRWSRLRDVSPDAEEIVADAVRGVFGLTEDEMPDDEAIDRVMN